MIVVLIEDICLDKSDEVQKIYEILNECKPPIQVIHWNYNRFSFGGDKVSTETHFENITPSCLYKKHNLEVQSHENDIDFPTSINRLNCIHLLPTGVPIDLYIFQDCLRRGYVSKCQETLKKRDIQLSSVRLYCLGIWSSLHFIQLFQDTPQDVYLDFKYLGRLDPHLYLKKLTLQDIMKDSSLKLFIILKLSSSNVKENVLRNTVYHLYVHILKENFLDFKIYPFYEKNDMKGCSQFLENYLEDDEKSEFHSKIYDIMELFGVIDIFASYHWFIDRKSRCSIQPALEREYLPKTVLYRDNQAIFFQIPFKKIEKLYLPRCWSPFDLMYTRSAKKIFNCITLGEKKEDLQTIYILNNCTIPFESVMKHNNAILSELFRNKLPECSILWHMSFLHVLAVQKFPQLKDEIFKKIRLLGDSFDYYLSLDPNINPLIMDKINACFWYAANNVHFEKDGFCTNPNFLKFYKDVYDSEYEYPIQFIVNQLLEEFKIPNSIYNILSHFYDYTDCGLRRFKTIILYNRPSMTSPLKPLFYLSSLSWKHVLHLYQQYLKQSSFSYDKNFKIEEYPEELAVIKSFSDKNLDNVCINLETCQPFGSLCVTDQKEINGYDLDTETCLRIFRMYCIEDKKYPENSYSLMNFLKNYYWIKNEIPVLFDFSVKQAMDKVWLIFKRVMECKQRFEYLMISNKYMNLDIITDDMYPTHRRMIMDDH